MRRIVFAGLLLIAGAFPALAASEGFTVTTCGVLPVPYTAGRPNAIVVDVNGNQCVVIGGNGFPAGSTPVGNAFSGADTASASATLPGAAGKFTYICGFTVSGLGATAEFTSDVTVGTLVGATVAHYTYVFQLGPTVQNTTLAVTYTPCVPANLVNTSISVIVPGNPGNTATQINAWGFQQ